MRWPFRKKKPLTFDCFRCGHEWHDGRCGVVYYDPYDSAWVEDWCECNVPKDKTVLVMPLTPAQRDVIRRLTDDVKPAPNPEGVTGPVVWTQLQFPGMEEET